MTVENPRIGWSQKLGRRCLRFTFGERLTANEARVAILKWKKAFRTETDTPVILIWDCKRMKGYDSDARVQWTQALKDMKSQIDIIWLVTDSTVIRMGAAVMSMLSSLNIRAVSSESEIVI